MIKMREVVWLLMMLVVVALGEDCPAYCRCYPSEWGRGANCTNNGLTPKSLLLSYPKVGILNLMPFRYGYATKLYPRMFASFRNVKVLNLNNCSILHIPNDLFGGLEEVVEIDLSYNNIKRINGGVFAPLKKLNSLVLRGNPLKLTPWEAIPSTSLRELDLGECHLKDLPNDYPLPSEITHLSLDGNELETIGHNLPRKITHLNLARNHIAHVPIMILIEYLTRLRKVDLSDNPIDCNCQLLLAQDYLSGNRAVIFEGDMRCRKPNWLAGWKTSDIDYTDLCNKGWKNHARHMSAFNWQKKLSFAKHLDYMGDEPEKDAEVLFENEQTKAMGTHMEDRAESLEVSGPEEEEEGHTTEEASRGNSVKEPEVEPMEEDSSPESRLELIDEELGSGEADPDSSVVLVKSEEIFQEESAKMISTTEETQTDPSTETAESTESEAKTTTTEEPSTVEEQEEEGGTEGEATSPEESEETTPAEGTTTSDEEPSQVATTTEEYHFVASSSEVADLFSTEQTESTTIPYEYAEKYFNLNNRTNDTEYEHDYDTTTEAIYLVSMETSQEEEEETTATAEVGEETTVEPEEEEEVTTVVAHLPELVTETGIVEEVASTVGAAVGEEEEGKEEEGKEEEGKEEEGKEEEGKEEEGKEEEGKEEEGKEEEGKEEEGKEEEEEKEEPTNSSVVLGGGADPDTSREEYRGAATYQSVGTYVVLGVILLLVGGLILLAVVRSRKRAPTKMRLDPECNPGTEMRDMDSLLPKPPENGVKILPKDYGEKPPVNGEVKEEATPVLSQNPEEDEEELPPRREELPQNGAPVEKATVRLTVLPESIPRTPVFIHKHASE